MNNYTGKDTYHHKIVLLGDMGVGKTCTSIRYVIIYILFKIMGVSKTLQFIGQSRSYTDYDIDI